MTSAKPSASSAASAFAVVALVAMVAPVFAGCGGSEIAPPGQPGQPPLSPDGPGVVTAPSGPAAPRVDPIAADTCGATVAISGTAEPGASVVVYGGASTGIATDASPGSGAFCLDVPLVKGSQSELEVRTIGTSGAMSPPTRVVVSQRDCTGGGGAGGEPLATEPSRNVALGAKATVKGSPKSGQARYLTDGDAKTTVRVGEGGLDGMWAESKTWVAIDLGQVYQLAKIVVRWRDKDKGEFGEKYKVLVSSMQNPGKPDPSNGNWTVLAQVDKGDGGTDTHDLAAKRPLAQHVALWLQFDGKWNINPFDGFSEDYTLGEIEVWHTPQTSTVVDTSGLGTCAARGQ